MPVWPNARRAFHPAELVLREAKARNIAAMRARADRFIGHLLGHRATGGDRIRMARKSTDPRCWLCVQHLLVITEAAGGPRRRSADSILQLSAKAAAPLLSTSVRLSEAERVQDLIRRHLLR